MQTNTMVWAVTLLKWKMVASVDILRLARCHNSHGHVRPEIKTRRSDMFLFFCEIVFFAVEVIRSPCL